MSEKVALPNEQMASLVHDALAGLAKNMNEGGAPPPLDRGRTAEIGCGHPGEGKVAAEQNVRDVLRLLVMAPPKRSPVRRGRSAVATRPSASPFPVHIQPAKIGAY